MWQEKDKTFSTFMMQKEACSMINDLHFNKKEVQYERVRDVITRPRIKEIQDVFKLIHKTIVCDDWGKPVYYLNNRLAHPEKWSKQDIKELSQVLGVSYRRLHQLIRH